LPLPQYIASPKFSTLLVIAAASQSDNYQQPCIFPDTCGKPCQNNPTLLKPSATEFYFCFFREKLSPPVPGFPRSVYACL